MRFNSDAGEHLNRLQKCCREPSDILARDTVLNITICFLNLSVNNHKFVV